MRATSAMFPNPLLFHVMNQAVEQRLGTLRKAVGAEAHVHLDFFPVGVVQKRKALIGNPAAALVAGMEQVVGLLPADFPPGTGCSNSDT